MTLEPRGGLVPEAAWDADERARRRGRVEMFNASRPGGLDGWTMEEAQYELMRDHILELAEDAGPRGVLLKDLVATAQARYETHPSFPKGRLRNYCTFTKVDLEARGLIERMAGSGPQRVRLCGPRNDPGQA